MALSSNFDRQCSLGDDPFMEALFDEAAGSSTSVGWKETATEHVLKADLLPGMCKEDVRVEVDEHRMLSIIGQRKREELQKMDTWHCMERSTRQFMRKFRLPENSNLDAITAKVDSGVLTVLVPKVEKKTRLTRSIAVAGITHDDKKMVTTYDKVANDCTVQ